MPITYRAPTALDVTPLSALGRETFVATFGDLYRPRDLNAFLKKVYSAETVMAELADEALDWQLAEHQGELIGYCKLLRGLSLDYDAGERKVVQLNQLYIRAPYQGMGVANLLMDWAIQHAKMLGADEMLLSVYCDNLRAQHFYQRYGFDHIGDTIFMVGTHEDHEFIYRKHMK